MIANAPIHFAFAVVTCCFIGSAVLRWIYRERMEAQDHLIRLYKDKYGKIHAEPSAPLGDWTNKRLRKRGLEIAASVEGLANRLHKQAIENMGASPDKAPNPAIAWRLDIQEALIKYGNDYKDEALLVRAEIKTRLLNSVKEPDLETPEQYSLAHYTHPTNPLGLKEVASDLKRLCRLLP